MAILPNLAVGDIFEVVTTGFLFDQTIMNTFHYQCSIVTGTPVNSWTAYSLFRDWWATASSPMDAMTAAATNEMQWTSIKIQTIAPTRYSFRNFDLTLAGVIDDTCGSANIAGSVERRGAVAGRTSVGRLQLAAPPVSQAIAGVWSVLQGSRFNVVAGKLLNTAVLVGGYEFKPVLTGVDPNSHLRHTTDIVDANIQREVRVMRRRTVGVGI